MLFVSIINSVMNIQEWINETILVSANVTDDYPIIFTAKMYSTLSLFYMLCDINCSCFLLLTLFSRSVQILGSKILVKWYLRTPTKSIRYIFS